MCGKWRHNLLTLITLFFFFAYAKGNIPFTYSVSYITIQDGLSNNNVTAIFQENSGYVWVGTYDGLNRYDGYAFKIFRHRYKDSSSLVSNRIVCINQDAGKNIWIGTKVGINIYNSLMPGLQPVWYIPYGTHQKEKMTTPVTNIVRDKENNMLVGTDGLGLLFSEKGRFVLTQIPYVREGRKVNDYPVRGIALGDHAVWVFVKEVGLCKVDHRRNTLQIVNTKVKVANCMEADKKGNLWIGTNKGLYKYNIATGTYTSYKEGEGGLTSGKVVDLCIDRHGNVWIATDGGGIDIYTNGGKFFSVTGKDGKISLPSESVYSVFEDREGRIWLGMLRGGMIVLDPNKPGFNTVRHNPMNKNSLVNNYVLSFCEDDNNNVWIGTDGGGLSIYNKRANTYKNFVHDAHDPRSLSSNFVTNICMDHNNQVWLATWGGGIDRYDKVQNGFKHYRCMGRWNEVKNVFVLLEDRGKNLWAGTVGGGLFRYDPSSDQFRSFDPSITNIISIYEDKKNNLWVGTYNKLIRIDKAHKGRDNKIYNIGRPVRSIIEGPSGSLWLGTEGGGLLHFNEAGGILKRYTMKDGLPSDVVLNILKDNSNCLWMSTYNGLSKLNLESKECTNYFQNDGIQSNQFNYNAAIKLRSGAFLFGGIKGYTRFYPDSIRTYKTSTRVLISNIWVNNTPLYGNSKYVTDKADNMIRSIELPYNKATLRINFVGVNYTLAHDLTYIYNLRGAGTMWNKNGKSRSISFPHLKEGSYTLHIKAVTTNHMLSDSEATLKITVLPPWYRTWWAYTGYLLLVAAIIIIYVAYRTRQTKLKYEVRIAQMNVEKEKEINEKKLNYFTNVTHEFRTPLTLILNPLKDMLKNNSEHDVSELRIVYNNARRMLSLVDQLLYFKKIDNTLTLKIAKVSFYQLCFQVYESFLLMAKNKHIRYHFICDNKHLKLECDRDKMEAVLYNLLNNAFKFTGSGGEVAFTIAEDGEEVSVKISDSGTGISPEIGDKIFEKFYQENKDKQVLDKVGFGIGLHLVKRLVEKHKGRISYTSIPGKGTTFCLKFPKAQDDGMRSIEEVIQPLEGVNPYPGKTIPADKGELSGKKGGHLSEAGEAGISGNKEEDKDKPVGKTPGFSQSALLSDKRSLLVIEDDAEMRDYIIRIFSGKFLIYEASNGNQGLQLARRHIPDIIISDVMMDDRNGVELCNMIKHNPSLNHIPIILVTGSPSDEMRLKGIEEGADDYITKPFDKDLLIARVDSLIQNRNNLQRYFYNRITFKESRLNISQEDKAFIDNCIEIVEQYCNDEDFNIKKLSEEIGMSHSNLYRKIKEITGQSLNGFIRYIRLRKAAELLISGNSNINQAAYEVGFSDIKYFRTQFKNLFGMNPSEYKKRFKGSFSEKYKINKDALK